MRFNHICTNLMINTCHAYVDSSLMLVISSKRKTTQFRLSFTPFWSYLHIDSYHIPSAIHVVTYNILWLINNQKWRYKLIKFVIDHLGYPMISLQFAHAHYLFYCKCLPVLNMDNYSTLVYGCWFSFDVLKITMQGYHSPVWTV